MVAIKRQILFSPPDITDTEINEVVEALKSGWITTGDAGILGTCS